MGEKQNGRKIKNEKTRKRAAKTGYPTWRLALQWHRLHLSERPIKIIIIRRIVRDEYT